MRIPNGEVNSLVAVMTDVTDAAMLQAKLMHTEKMAAVGQLLSGVAHEVNNPLTAIMGFADLLLENPELSSDIKEDLQVIVQEAQRTREIVQNLLSFARQTPPEKQFVDVNQVLRKTIALRGYDLSNHGIELTDDLDPKLPEVIGDAHQLQQVFLNILNNACDAVQETGGRGKIVISTASVSGSVEVRFQDNGPGIKNAERIFDPFYTTKEVGKGTGLGLSICYGIVREHNGEIVCCNNDQNEGATFMIRLPLPENGAPKVLAKAAGRQA
jgi:two-component system NtrC family sensor kinase